MSNQPPESALPPSQNATPIPLQGEPVIDPSGQVGNIPGFVRVVTAEELMGGGPLGLGDASGPIMVPAAFFESTASGRSDSSATNYEIVDNRS